MGKIELNYIAGKDAFEKIPTGTAVLYNAKYSPNKEDHWYSGVIKNHAETLCLNGMSGVFINSTDKRVITNEQIYEIFQNSENDYLIEVTPDFLKTKLRALELGDLRESLRKQMNVENEVTQKIIKKGGIDTVILDIICDLPTIQKEYVHRYS